jgi:hypothetical protein
MKKDSIFDHDPLGFDHVRTVGIGDPQWGNLADGEVSIDDHDGHQFVYAVGADEADELARWFAENSETEYAVYKTSECSFSTEELAHYRIRFDDGREHAARSNLKPQPVIWAETPTEGRLGFSAEDAEDCWPPIMLDDLGMREILFDSVNAEQVQAHFSKLIDSALEQWSEVNDEK